MNLQIGDTAPDFTAQTSEGCIGFHDWLGDGWAILFSRPGDSAPACITEQGYIADLRPEFDRRSCKIIGLSIDPVSDHASRKKDIEETRGHAVTLPLICDEDLAVAKLYGMTHPEASGSSKGRMAVDNATVRSVLVIGPDKKIEAMLAHPISTGHDFDEVLRLLDCCQRTAKHRVATLVNGRQGENFIIVPAVSDEDAKLRFPGGWEAPRPYLRIVPQPLD